MTHDLTNTADTCQAEERLEWTKPDLQRMAANEAEAGAPAVVDAGVFS